MNAPLPRALEPAADAAVVFKLNGTAKASALIEQPRWDLPLLEDLSLVMRDASICGLGQAAPNPIDCVVKYFPHELAP